MVAIEYESDGNIYFNQRLWLEDYLEKMRKYFKVVTQELKNRKYSCKTYSSLGLIFE